MSMWSSWSMMPVSRPRVAGSSATLWPRDTRIVYTVHGYLHPWPPRARVDRVVQRLEQMKARWTDLMLFQSKEDLYESQARRYASRLVYLGTAWKTHGSIWNHHAATARCCECCT